MQKLLTATLLMPFLAGCQQPIEVNRAPPPPEKLVCKGIPAVPVLDALEAITINAGTPDEAQVYLKNQVDGRDAFIADAYVEVRGVAFDCKSQLMWNAEYWAN